MTLDINIELFSCAVSDSLHVVLSTTLSLDGSKEEEKGWRDVGKGGDAPATIADLYDYVCHGKIYRFEETYDGNTMYVTVLDIQRVVGRSSEYTNNVLVAMPMCPSEACSCRFKALSRSSHPFESTTFTCSSRNKLNAHCSIFEASTRSAARRPAPLTFMIPKES